VVSPQKRLAHVQRTLKAGEGLLWATKGNLK
jgi:hypothetical protein